MADLKLSGDGMYYWDGRQWVSTLSPDGRFRWDGSTWVPVAAAVAPAYPHYQQPATARVPTPWTKPMQYAVAALYLLEGLYALSLPFWMSGAVTNIFNQSFQRQASLNPNVSPPPPEVVASFASMMAALLWVGALIGVAIATVVIIGALKRWTWMFYVVLVLQGLGAISLPFNLIGAITGSVSMNIYNFPAWISWLSVAVGIPGAALFVWMLIGVIRYGPWAMTKKVDWPASTAQAPAN